MKVSTKEIKRKKNYSFIVHLLKTGPLVRYPAFGVNPTYYWISDDDENDYVAVLPTEVVNRILSRFKFTWGIGDGMQFGYLKTKEKSK